MALAIFKQNYKADIAQEILKEYSFNSEDTYYLFVGKVDEWANDNNPPNSVDAVEDEIYAFRNSFFVKQITENDVKLVVNKFPWVTGQVYTQYTDNLDLFDETLPQGSSRFFTYTTENHVYKCLENNGGTASTDMPTGTKTIPITTADGYKWKYMFTVPAGSLDFETSYKIPVEFASSSDTTSDLVNQYNVQSAAVRGSFDVVELTNAGAQFPLGTTGAGMPASVTESAGSTAITLAGLIDPQENIYTGYTVKIVDGYGEGQVRKITGNTGAKLYVDRPWTIPPSSTDDVDAGIAITEAQVIPSINVFGDGTGLEVTATLDSNKRVNGISIVSGGQDYTTVSYEIYPGITGPYDGGLGTGLTLGTQGQHRALEGSPELELGEVTLNFVSSPANGHGSDARVELGANSLIILMSLQKSEFDLLGLSGGNDFRQFGIIKNPKFTENYLSGAYTGIVAGKHLPKLYDIKVNQPTGINFDGTEFNSTNLEGLTAPAGLNSTYIMGAASKTIARAREWSAESVGRGTLTVEQPSGDFIINENLSWFSIVEGNTESNANRTLEFDGFSGANVGKYDDISQSSTATTVAYYDQTVKVYVQATGGANYSSSGPFVADDVYKNYTSGISGASFRTMNWAGTSAGVQGTGLLHGIDYLGVMTAGDYLYSSTGATFGYITGVTGPDLSYSSGEVLYIQNMRPVLRTDEQEEEIKIQIGF